MTEREASVDIIPATDRGEFCITAQMLTDADPKAMAGLESRVREEAHRRGLDLQVSEDALTRDIIVRWRKRPIAHAEEA